VRERELHKMMPPCGAASVCFLVCVNFDINVMLRAGTAMYLVFILIQGCMCVCVFACVIYSVLIHGCMCVCVCVCMCKCMCVLMCLCMCMCMYMYVYTHAQTRTQTYAYTHTHVLARTQTNTHTLFTEETPTCIYKSPTLQRTKTYCSTLPHTVMHYNILQHTATHYHTPNINTTNIPVHIRNHLLSTCKELY